MPCKTKLIMTWPRPWIGRSFCRFWVNIRNLGLLFLANVYGVDSVAAARVDADIAGLCDRAAIEASRTRGVPLDVLKAISRTETGRSVGNRLQPWPWTVNMEGTGRWFATLDEARAYVFLNFKKGARSFDVGCFQINYKWHGGAFRSIDDMFDPETNAQYAAKYLVELYQEFGNWPDAVGAYHSRTPELAKKYTARFDRILAGLSVESEGLLPGGKVRWHQTETQSRTPTLNAGPRPLVVGGTVALGSLVPIVRQPGTGPRPFVVLK
jgi:transglycosylase-like protein with SLT domain